MPLYCSQGHENLIGNRFCQQCGEKLPLPSSTGIYPGAVLGGRYRIEREIGQGGFGRTYLAFDLNRFNEACVLKEFAPQVQGTYALGKAEELFEREAGVLYKLQHPQIPRFRELFRFSQEGKGYLFLVQDYVEGQTYHALLDTRRRQGLRFIEVEVTQMLLQILPVLEYIHSHGVIHRDISPDNMILRNSDGLPVLIDFGGVKQVAATVESQFLQPGGSGGTAPMPTRLGKMGYAPPEQIQRGIVAPHSDLYALAATVLVLLTGKEPDSLIDHQTLNWKWRQEVSISPTLGAVLDKMLANWPKERYQSALEVLQALTYSPVPPVYHSPQPPLPATGATLAVAPAPTPSPIGQGRYVSPGQSSSGSSSPLGKILLVLAVVAIAGGIGWLGGNLWLNSQSQPNPKPTEAIPPPSSSPPSPVETVTPSPQLSTQEQQRQAALRRRRTALGINYDFYVDLVNQAFWSQNPTLQGRRLGNAPEDQQLREQWDEVAAQLLDKIEQASLSQEARSKLGKYQKDDRDRFKVAANKLHVGSRTLYDLADGAFFYLFPQQQRGQNFIDQPVGQIWQAIAFDKLKALQSGSALTTIHFDSGATSKQVNDILNPGEGKVYLAQLAAGQLMDLKLKASKESLLSIYSPGGQNPLLEDSRAGGWTGKLPESGYYEFVVVSTVGEPLDYQLNLNVNNPSPPPSPQPSDSVTPSPVPSTTSPSPSPSPSISSTASPQVSPTPQDRN